LKEVGGGVSILEREWAVRVPVRQQSGHACTDSTVSFKEPVALLIITCTTGIKENAALLSMPLLKLLFESIQ